MGSPEPIAREIHVKVLDRHGNPIPGAKISWTEDGEARGSIPSSKGFAVLHPVEENSEVEVTAECKGSKQVRKPAVGQNLCEFNFTDMPKTPTKVIVAAITTLGAIAVAYIQFWPGSQEAATLTVYVKDADSSVGIANARVSVEGINTPTPKPTDSDGKALFELKVKKNETLTIAGSAANYENAAVTTKDTSQPVNLFLKRKLAAPMPVPASAAPIAPTKPTATGTVDGTWEVRVSGDIALQRVRSGSFSFSTLLNGSTSVTADVTLDGATTRLQGTASRQNDRFFLEYEAKTSTGSWTGKGQLSLAKAALEGYLTDADGKQVPVLLRKP